MGNKSRKTHYEILGVKQTARLEEIKRAFRRRALRLHPDRNPGDYRAAAKFRRVNEAYEVLSDPDRRRAYDIALENSEAAERERVAERKRSERAAERERAERAAEDARRRRLVRAAAAIGIPSAIWAPVGAGVSQGTTADWVFAAVWIALVIGALIGVAATVAEGGAGPLFGAFAIGAVVVLVPVVVLGEMEFGWTIVAGNTVAVGAAVVIGNAYRWR